MLEGAVAGLVDGGEGEGAGRRAVEVDRDLAAALARGETTITSVQRIERGYGELAVRTKGLSLSIAAS